MGELVVLNPVIVCTNFKHLGLQGSFGDPVHHLSVMAGTGQTLNVTLTKSSLTEQTWNIFMFVSLKIGDTFEMRVKNQGMMTSITIICWKHLNLCFLIRMPLVNHCVHFESKHYFKITTNHTYWIMYIVLQRYPFWNKTKAKLWKNAWSKTLQSIDIKY